jgi:predicted outer membrane repeat protein
MKENVKTSVGVLTALGINAALMIASAPAQAVGLTGTIGLSFSITAVATGFCGQLGSSAVAVPCTDPTADPTLPLTTLDFSNFSGAPGFPQNPPFGGEASVTDATGDFALSDPPPPAFGQVRDLPTPSGNFTPTDWAQLFYTVSGGPIPGSGEPILAYSVDLLTLDFPEYFPTATGVTVNLSYTTRVTRVTDGAVGEGSGSFSGDILFIRNVCGTNSGGAPICTASLVQEFFRTAGNTLPVLPTDPEISASTTLEVSAASSQITVPEPSSLVGLLALGVLGGGNFLLRSKKQK